DGVLNNSDGVINAARNYWGAADGPSGEGFGSGDSISEKVNFIPFFVDAALTDLSYGGDQEEVAIIADEVIEEGDEVVITGTMNIGDGTTPVKVTIKNGTLAAGKLDLKAGAVLEVV